MYPKFIELHEKETDMRLCFNTANITVFTDQAVDTDREGFEVAESYDEIKQLIHDCGCLIHKADPRIDTTKRLTTKDLEKMIGEPVWNSNTWKWELVWECSADGIVTTRDCGADYEYNEDDLIKTPLYSMKGKTHEQ